MYNILFGGRRKKFEVNSAESTYKVHYLGNVMTSLLKRGGVGVGSGGGDTLTKSTSRKVAETKSNSSSISSAKSARLNSISEEDDDDDEPDDELVDYLECLGAGGVRQDEQLELSCVDKPVRILWDNHLKNSGQAGIKMKLTLTKAGLRVTTKDHGVTEYFGHRIHLITTHTLHPKLLVWVYQHVGRTLKTEIRCHAALCHRAQDAQNIERQLKVKLRECLLEYKREKRRVQNSRLCNTRNHGVLEEQLGAKKKHLRTLTRNYKPPVQHGMCAAPKLDDVVEEEEEEEDEDEEHEMASESSENQMEADEYEEYYREDEVEQYSRDRHPDLVNSKVVSKGATKTENDLIEEEEEEDDDEEEVEDTDSEEESSEDDDEYYEYEEGAATGADATSDVEYDLAAAAAKANNTETVSSSTAAITKRYDNRPVSATPTTTTAAVAAHNHRLILSSTSSSSSTSSISSTSPSPLSVTQTTVQHKPQQRTLQPPLERMPTSLTAAATATDSTNKQFTEVSYEFLGDLSMCSSITPKLSHSKSFSKFIIPSSTTAVTASSKTPQLTQSSFANPFRRTSVSKSFSAFTSRLKMQQHTVQKPPPVPLPQQQHHTTTCSQMDSSITTITPVIKQLNELQLNTASTSSSLSSPTLSTCSNSSMSSASKLLVNGPSSASSSSSSATNASPPPQLVEEVVISL